MGLINSIYKTTLDILYYATFGYSGVRYHTCVECKSKFYTWKGNFTAYYCSTACQMRS